MKRLIAQLFYGILLTAIIVSCSDDRKLEDQRKHSNKRLKIHFPMSIELMKM